MTSEGVQVDTVNAILSDREDFMDELDEASINWSQDDPVLTGDLVQLEKKYAADESRALCRLCAGQAIHPVFIYSDLGETMRLEHKINTCLSIKVRKTDPFPKQLCHACIEKINWCERFDRECVKAEETHVAMLEQTEEEQTTSENAIAEDNAAGEEFCPLCMDGRMQTNAIENSSEAFRSSIYDSDVVMESSDEEEFLTKLETEIDENSTRSPAGSQQYLKCGACKNLYHTKKSLEAHKCKPNIQVTSKPYKCLVCETTFSFEERLNFHERFHRGAKELYCEICRITFGKELKLFYHWKRYHCEDKSVSCLQCGKLFSNQQELRVHVCTDGKTRPHICEICNKGFTDGYTLKRHVVTHLPEKPYKCTQCIKSFTQKSRLNKHIAGHGIVVENAQLVWKCVQCGQTFDDCNDADSHNRNYHESKISLLEELTTSKIYHCEFCNSYFNDLNFLRDHQSRHTCEKPYTCNACDRVYKSYAEAVVHWKEHPRAFKVATAYLCDVCGKDMKDMSLLYKHRHKRHHLTARMSENGGNKKFVCESCGKIFDTSEDLRVHGRDQCSKFPCDICGSLLPTANSLHAHKRRHSGLRPYVCNICGKSYTQSSHMWTHKRFHMGVKPYACQYCDQKFTIKPDLADHTRRKHTRERPFKCDVCNKAFLTGSVFYQHRLIHRGDRRYKCQYCEKAFTRTEALNNHIKIHTGEKPHACDVCGRCFRQKGDMRKHRRTQHVLSKAEPLP